MFNPANITLGEISSTIRDFSIVGFLCGAAWYSRGIYDTVKNFLKRISNHMDSMESFARTVVDNHLKHIEADLKVMSGRMDDTAITRNTHGEIQEHL